MQATKEINGFVSPVKYTKGKTKALFECLHDMTSQRPKILCIFTDKNILHTFIGQRHNFLWGIYMRDIQSMFVHIIDDRYQKIPSHKLTRVCQLPAQTL